MKRLISFRKFPQHRTMSQQHINAQPLSRCPVAHAGSNIYNSHPGGPHYELDAKVVGGVDGAGGSSLDQWYPERVRPEILNRPSPVASPYGPNFNYAEEFKKVDLQELKKDLAKWMTTSQPWWPADYGNYGPQVIRMVWHSAGTYRIGDGRGGNGQALQRMLPINSWLDNGNTDKTRRLLWPIKQKYGSSLSWADLIAMAGNVAFESMGLPPIPYGGGREDAWEVDDTTFWGSELEMLGRDGRWKGDITKGDADLENPLADSEYGLIYVNPEGPAGSADPAASAKEIRLTFGRMAMNDEETVALIAGGHTFGKSHGAVGPENMGPAPEAAPIENMGLGWINKVGTGNAQYTITNGIEGSWVQHPTVWDKEYLINLLDLEWEPTKSPAGAGQWKPKGQASKTPDAHLAGVEHPLMMMTSDIALKVDPNFRKVLEKFRDNPIEVYTTAFSKAWFKLMHRDMGPKTRYVGALVPEEDELFQDPIPALNHEVVDAKDVAYLKGEITASGLAPASFARVAWGSASTHRCTDHRGGANGARIRLAPQKNWEVNQPKELAEVLGALEKIQSTFNGKQKGNKLVSLADLIVLGGNVAIEDAAKKAGIDVAVPFVPGRMDTSDELTDHESFEWLHPIMDGFRNYETKGEFKVSPEAFLVDRAKLLGLSLPQLVALLGGMRTLGLNWDGSPLGVFTKTPGVFTNDWFVNLLDTGTAWTPIDEKKTRFEGTDRETGAHRWFATRTDLIIGHEAQLRAVAEVYGAPSATEKLVKDFIDAWTHVMMLDRFDITESSESYLPKL